MAEVTFVIEGTGKKGADSSLTDITFTKIKIGDKESEEISGDAGPDHKNAKKALSELLSKSADETGVSESSSPDSDDGKLKPLVETSVSSLDISTSNGGGSSHKRKSYKKEKKIKGGKRKSMRRHKHV
jgi:hypothetical protein